MAEMASRRWPRVYCRRGAISFVSMLYQMVVVCRSAYPCPKHDVGTSCPQGPISCSCPYRPQAVLLVHFFEVEAVGEGVLLPQAKIGICDPPYCFRQGKIAFSEVRINV